VSKGGRKGRISNELVAASCAAILTVYAAGHWRTRDEARRLGAQAQTRRPVRPAAAVPAIPVLPEALASTPAVSVASDSATTMSTVAGDPLPAATPLPQSAAAPSPATAGQPGAAKPSTPTAASAPVVASVPAVQETTVDAQVDVAAEAAESAPAPMWRDGYYTGWGTSPHGDIEARVTIKDGKIVDAGILNCATRYPCYVIDKIINQPVIWQSPDVDRVSRATESADAYYWGLVEALKKAEIAPAAPAAAVP
jgi:uncharacterized protein with FMN-binding domain